LGTISRRLRLLLTCRLLLRGSRELPCHFLALPRHHRLGVNSSHLKPGRRRTTPRPAMLLVKKTPRLEPRTAFESRNTAALFLGSSDTGPAVTEEGLECRRLRCSRRISTKTRLGRRHLCMLLRRELILLRRMQGLPLVQDLLVRRRLLLRIGIISHGRVSCYC
jgi:hypothetical protein